MNAAQGVRGGLPGCRASQGQRDADGKTHQLPAWGQVTLAPEQRVFSSSCGGGGYGHPHLRNADKVAQQVAEGWLTKRRALEIYGVALQADGTPDTVQTEQLRRALSAALTDLIELPNAI